MEKRKRMIRTVGFVLILMCLIMSQVCMVFAGGEANFGENIGTWIVDQAFYIGIAVAVCIMVPMIAKRAWVPLVIMVIVTGILLFLIRSPENLVTIGEKLFSILQ